jgi:hypothetical protein
MPNGGVASNRTLQMSANRVVDLLETALVVSKTLFNNMRISFYRSHEYAWWNPRDYLTSSVDGGVRTKSRGDQDSQVAALEFFLPSFAEAPVERGPQIFDSPFYFP